MNTSFSKESLSLLMIPRQSSPTRSEAMSRSPSGLWLNDPLPHQPVQEQDRLNQIVTPHLKEEVSFSTLIGKVEPSNVSKSGAPKCSPQNAAPSASITKLQSKVAPEKILESPPPLRKILHISRSDLMSFAQVLNEYKSTIEIISTNIHSK